MPKKEKKPRRQVFHLFVLCFLNTGAYIATSSSFESFLRQWCPFEQHSPPLEIQPRLCLQNTFANFSWLLHLFASFFHLKVKLPTQSCQTQTWSMIILSNCSFLKKEEERTVVARFLIWSCSKLRGSDNWSQVTLIKNPNFFRLGAAHGGEIIYTGTIISEIRPPGICSIWSCNQFYPTFCSSPPSSPFFCDTRDRGRPAATLLVGGVSVKMWMSLLV